MPRYLGKKDNVFRFRDGVSGDFITFLYRTPDTTELQEFYTESYSENGEGGKSTVVDARVRLAKKIITGIGDNSFELDEGKFLSSNPDNPDYKENWKDLIELYAGDTYDLFVFKVFQENRFNVEKSLPLPKSSGG